MAIPIQTIPSTDFEKKQMVGKGGFGSVYYGTWNGVAVAIKELFVQSMDKIFAQEFQHEAQMMANCQHPHIVRLYGICAEQDKLALIMEYLEKGSLYSLLKDTGVSLPWTRRYSIATDTAKGLYYLHDRKIVHQDLKSQNILLDENYKPKISDFGLAKVRLETSSRMTGKNTGGSVRWMAPELLSEEISASSISDIYSFGMVLWEIAARSIPFSKATNDSLVIAWKIQNKTETIPSDCPLEFGQIIQRCWALPKNRPSAKELANDLSALHPAVILEPVTTVDDFHSNTVSKISPLPVKSSQQPVASGSVYLSNLLPTPTNKTQEATRPTLPSSLPNTFSIPRIEPSAPPQSVVFARPSQPPSYADFVATNSSPSITAVPAPFFIPATAFGKAAWTHYMGDIGDEPPLPTNIQQLLNNSCPFFPGKKIEETHLLMLIPQAVKGKPLTLRTLGDFVNNAKQGHKARYSFFFSPGENNQHADIPLENSYWVLMTKDVIPGSRSKTYADQLKLLPSPYQPPKLLEAAICLFMEYVRTGKRLYSDDPNTFTRCQEKHDKDSQTGIGGFSDADWLTVASLKVNKSPDRNLGMIIDSVGLAGLWKL